MINIFTNLVVTLVANSGFIAAIIALASFLYTTKRQREIEKDSIYQRLELASIDLFRWEAANRKELSRIKNEYPDISPEDEEFLETWCVQVMNLFELCIHHENRRTFPNKVFGSWLPWIYEFANEPVFYTMWPEIKLNYLPECRKIMEYAIEYSEDIFIEEMCKRYHLRIDDWMEYPTDDKKSFANANVEVKKGSIKNREKYLAIFNECKHDSYISHGEVFYGRATNDLKWADDITMQMRQEFSFYIVSGKYDVLEILLADELIGFAILEINNKTKAAILSDIMIKKNYQGKGIGKEALHKIEEHLKNKKIGIIILESGIKNEKAHDFFEKNGYNKISVEYSKGLGSRP